MLLRNRSFLSHHRFLLVAWILIVMIPGLSIAQDQALQSGMPGDRPEFPPDLVPGEGCSIEWDEKFPGEDLTFGGFAYSCNCSENWRGYTTLEGSIASGHWLHMIGAYHFKFQSNPDTREPNRLKAKTESYLYGIGKGTRCDLEHLYNLELEFTMDTLDSYYLRLTRAISRSGYSVGMCEDGGLGVMPLIFLPSGFAIRKKPFDCREYGLEPSEGPEAACRQCISQCMKVHGKKSNRSYCKGQCRTIGECTAK